MTKNFFLLIIIIIFTLILYGLNLFIYWTYLKIFDEVIDKFTYLIPLFFLVLLTLLVIVFRFINDCIFRWVYLSAMTILGIELNVFMSIIIYHIINLIYEMPRIVGILFSMIIPGLFSLYGLINAQITKIDKIKIKLKYTSLPKPIKIAHLSDIHFGANYQRNFCEFLVEKIKEINPDVVVITGDMSDGSMKVKHEWMEPFNEIKPPILYITGNHEELHGKEDMLKEVAKTKVKHIGDQIVHVAGAKFVGVDYESDLDEALPRLLAKDKDLDFEENKVNRSLIENEQNKEMEENKCDNFKNNYKKLYDKDCRNNINDKNEPIILLYHVPLIEPKDLSKYNITLGLFGHTHGGQLIPLHIPTYFANKCFAGLYSYNDTNFIYVSSGVGLANVPMRTFSRSVIGEIILY